MEILIFSYALQMVLKQLMIPIADFVYVNKHSLTFRCKKSLSM